MAKNPTKKAAVFLNGSYPEEQLPFYLERIDQASGVATIVAVDGALRLFHRLQRKPDLIIGDFDSVDADLLSAFADIDRRYYPSEKDQTDGEIALCYLLEQGYKDIDIYGAIDTNFETDQMLANIFNLALATRHARETGNPINIRLVDHRQHIYLIEDDKLTLQGAPGDLFSVLPLSSRIILTISGARWELERTEVEFGLSRPLRNRFTSEGVRLEIEGMALVIQRHG
ncbi:MAG: thiamine diphosphokinase [candidate division Zixibacteria bacterium]|nr:thiamine diphosphokinase [candidate division Zixibacteria bacterium]